MHGLIVEDSKVIRKMIFEILSSAGYDDILEAENGIEALALLDIEVELILTDFNMPGMDGLTFIKEVQKNPIYAKIPIIMITTRGAKSEVVEAVKQGVKGYIVKPFDKTTLLNKVKNTLLYVPPPKLSSDK